MMVSLPTKYSTFWNGVLLAYGTTEKLSKFWIPLDEFTKVTMEGLRKGEQVISMSVVKGMYEKFEREKEGMVLQMMQKFESAENHQ